MLTFRYVLAGWEGSSHDGAVLEAAFDAGFVVPTGKYYLGDAGFGLTPWCLTLLEVCVIIFVNGVKPAIIGIMRNGLS